MEAITVCVDLQDFIEPHKFQTLAEYLGHALHTSICQKKISRVKWTPIRPQEWTDSIITVVNNFVTETNRSIFIHWDEVSSLWLVVDLVLLFFLLVCPFLNRLVC